MQKTGEYAGLKVTIMGLGLNGGGLESARFLALRGAECTVTDTKGEEVLRPSIEKLEAIQEKHAPFRYVLGRHEMADFTHADMVIKNPGVRPDSPFLAAAKRIETDISLFLAACPARLCAVTGSKGKSGTSSALHWVLAKAREARLLPGKAYLGGNITVSPLTFLDELKAEDDVVLELSSWQLGDIKGRSLLKPRIAVLTAIMPDHQDYYGSMEAYVNDKRIIYQGQNKDDATIACSDDEWGRSFLAQTPGRPVPYSVRGLGTGDWGSGNGEKGEANNALPSNPLVPGKHQMKNLLAAATALLDLELPADFIRQSLGSFPGIAHRLEFFYEADGVRFYNDTAATIPEAAAAAVEALGYDSDKPLVLVTGGTDKNLDFSPLVKAAAAASGIILLAGTGSDKLMPLLKQAGLSYSGPFDNINNAVQTAKETALKLAYKASSRQATVVLSPGCSSFGMFRNEFDRGNKWKEAVIKEKE